MGGENMIGERLHGAGEQTDRHQRRLDTFPSSNSDLCHTKMFLTSRETDWRKN